MKTALAIAAHPDDIEFLMAGTLMLLADAGYETHYWNLANGCCGTTQYSVDEIIVMRREEGAAAAAGMGAIYHESICNDLEIFYDRPTLLKVASVIRKVKPEILLTHSPVDYMEDHVNACRLAVTGTFSRGMKNFPVDPPHEPTLQATTVYHAQPYSHHDPLGQLVLPNYFVDTSGCSRREGERTGQAQITKAVAGQKPRTRLILADTA